MDRDKIIKKLDKLKAEHPEQKIIVETPKGSVDLKIGDALMKVSPHTRDFSHELGDTI